MTGMTHPSKAVASGQAGGGQASFRHEAKIQASKKLIHSIGCRIAETFIRLRGHKTQSSIRIGWGAERALPLCMIGHVT